MHYDQKEKAEEGERIAALATWAVFFLMIIKGATGLVLGSIATCVPIVRPNWQYTQEYVHTLGGILFIPRLRPKRLDGTGP